MTWITISPPMLFANILFNCDDSDHSSCTLNSKGFLPDQAHSGSQSAEFRPVIFSRENLESFAFSRGDAGAIAEAQPVRVAPRVEVRASVRQPLVVRDHAQRERLEVALDLVHWCVPARDELADDLGQVRRGDASFSGYQLLLDDHTARLPLKPCEQGAGVEQSVSVR